MCEITQKANINAVRGQRIEDVYRTQNQNLPWNQIQPFTCPVTQQYLGEQYVLHTGACTKAFSEEIYQGIIRNPRTACALCRAILSRYQQNMQISAPREIINHFCETCASYLGHVYRKVAGMDTSYIGSATRAAISQPFRKKLPKPQPKQFIPDLAWNNSLEYAPQTALPFAQNSTGIWTQTK